MVAPTRVNGARSSGIALAPGTLADDDVDPEVLHRHVEHLLGRPRHPVDLVEEEHLALGELREDGREVAGVLNRRAAGDAQRRVHLGRDDHGEGGLAEARRTRQQHVVGSAATLPSPIENQRQLLAHPFLADELGQVLGPKGRVDEPVVDVGMRVDDRQFGRRPVHHGKVVGDPRALVGHARAPLDARNALRSNNATSGLSSFVVIASASLATAATASSASRVE